MVDEDNAPGSYFYRERMRMANRCYSRTLPYSQRGRNYCPDNYKETLSLDLISHENAHIIPKEIRLAEATFVGNSNVMLELLKSGVSVNTKELNRVLSYLSKNHMTPLQIAAARGHVDCLKLLIEFNADVNAKDSFDVTAMHMAAQEGHFSCLQVLLEAGADCNTPTKYSTKDVSAQPYFGGTTPLHLAAVKNKVECVKELIMSGADYNAVDELGRSPLYVAAECGFEQCVLVQLRNAMGRKILSLPGNETGDTPLHFTVRQGMFEAVKELVLLGSDVNHANLNGRTPLYLAITSVHHNRNVSLGILELLVSQGYNCDVNYVDSFGYTPLHWAIFEGRRELRDMAKILIAYGANVNIFDDYRRSLINYEYNLVNSDISLLFKIVQSMSTPPPLSELKCLTTNIPITFDDLIAEFGWDPWMNNFDEVFMEQPFLEWHHNRVQPNIHGKQQWYSSLISNPRPLMHFCRYSIRTAMGYKRLREVDQLPLPRILKSYMLLENEEF